MLILFEWKVQQKNVIMESLLFRTDIHTTTLKGELLNALENVKGLASWKFDFDSIYKPLRINGIGINYLEVIKELERFGIKATRLYEE